MALGVQSDMAHQLVVQPTPMVVIFAELLALPSLEFRQRIETELNQNPALESVDSCTLCGEVACVGKCQGAQLQPVQRLPCATADASDVPSTLDGLAHRPTSRESLLCEVRPLLKREEIPIAEYLVGSLDERGFLDAGPEDIAATLGTDANRVGQTLLRMREVAHPGLGARDIRECLLLQLERLEKAGRSHRVARSIIENHLPDLARGRYRRIARALGVTVEDVLAARHFVRTHLRPYPGCEPVDLEHWAAPPSPPAMVPDVIIRPRDDKPGEFDVEVAEPLGFALRIAPLYLSLARRRSKRETEHRALPGGDGSDAPPEAVQHARAHVRRAESFLSLLDQRTHTLQRIAQVVADQQKSFLQRGPRYLHPLTRGTVARVLGLHESTVSRATAGKHARLPSGKVIPLADFFRASLGVQETLRAIVAAEPYPMTDRELCERLQTLGYSLARRTVTKYRSRLGLPPGTAR
jgi:RNA polymerase sigma-54 factor